MKRLIVAVLTVLSLVTTAWAQEPVARNPEIESTIQRQIDAFKADDLATAFSFAAPSIQGMFRTPDVFGMMVKRGYPMVWRPGDVRFTELRDEGSEMAQRVLIRDQEGRSHLLEYRLIDEGGQWRISGVQLLPQPGVAA
ncbi:DUF4864 domain-containing protein [Puniceibacterium confluentis]|uniref:DUF4864 domain-containing protein n=1 Tax=Puniceibacterium confluentis TaxID=1958944 RepID=UPI0011B5BCD5|nr:DUF4864 domain-containing protein [Puniceibacterium confluentis]